MAFEMVDVQGTIMGEIADKDMTRDDVAMTYAFALRQHMADGQFDFRAVNRAIIDRWSMSALHYIKAKAWRTLEVR